MPTVGVSIKCLEEMYLGIIPVLNVFPPLLFVTNCGIAA